MHGRAKVDWVTEWFLGLNVNWTVSPTAAVYKKEPVSAMINVNDWLVALRCYWD